MDYLVRLVQDGYFYKSRFFQRLLQYLVVLLLFSSSTYAIDLESISLRDKIGQMIMIGINGKTVSSNSAIIKKMLKNNIGGVILFDYDFNTRSYNKNIDNPKQLRTLIADLQSITLNYRETNWPLLIAVDYEGGKVNRLKEKYGFPPAISAQEVSLKGTDFAETSAESMAQTLKDNGFNLNFAPVIDVNVNPGNPVIGRLGRSFSSDPKKVAIFGAIFTRHYLNKKIQCAYKHFPGHGSSNSDSHLGFVDVTNTWQPKELEPFAHLIKSRQTCGVIMTAHIVNRQLDESGLPATLSHKILTEILRHQLQFKGVIISDDMHMKAIADNYGLAQALVLSINAGIDILVFGNNLTEKTQDPEELVDIIEAKVESGEISMQRINDAYQRIIELKKSIYD